ncbi:hypothetical protein CDV55_102277 [Aspergillus turcosus]|nr:hypothetical protein CDV55_102277 [Aspergillus turcosus]
MERKFDHISFTVCQCGGQCPAIITKTEHIERAAKNIAWVEYLNSGQIGLKVNRVSVHPAVQRKLVERMPSYLNEFNKKGDTDCMTHIVNEKNSDALKDLLEKSHQGKIEYGGELDALQNRITPRDDCQVLELTSVLFKKPESICPILTSTSEEGIDSINSQDEEIDHDIPCNVLESSLCFKLIALVISSTISGCVTVTGVITYANVPAASFGGAGDSGRGYYHGEQRVKAFPDFRIVAKQQPRMHHSCCHCIQQTGSNVSIRISLGIWIGSSLDDERRVATRGFVAKHSVRLLKVLACLAVVGLIDYRTDQPCGVLHGVEAVAGSIWSFLYSET